MVVLMTYKIEKDPIKNEDGRVSTALCIEFSDAQGQLTPPSMVGSGGISNTSETLWFSSLPAKM